MRTGIGCDVFDIDLEGLGTVRELYAEGYRLPRCPAQRTGSGGCQLFFAPTGLGNKCRFIPGCDWRGVNGYAIVPPSTHPNGERYQWCTFETFDALHIADGPVAHLFSDLPDVPDWLLARLNPPRPIRDHVAFRPVRDDLMPHYAAAALNDECHKVATTTADGSRHQQRITSAFKIGQLVGGGCLGYDDAYTHLVAAALIAQPLKEAKARQDIADGLAAGARNPRCPR